MNEKSKYSDYQILFAKYLEGSATEEELENVLYITQNNVEAANQLYHMRYMYAVMTAKDITIHSEKAYESFLERIHKSPKSVFRRSLWYSISSVAAIFLIIVGYLFLFAPNSNKKESYIAQTDDSISNVSLEDSSFITLNKHSQIVVHHDFNIEKREVFLEGEAFFEVSASSKPFIVNVGNIQVLVVGTKFNVHDDTQRNIISVHVQEGIVTVSCDSNRYSVNSGEYFEYNTINNTMILQKETYSADSWKIGTYVFENAYLSEVVTVLNERFRAKISFSNEFESVQINASFHDSDSTELISMLQLILQAEVSITHNGAYLHK